MFANFSFGPSPSSSRTHQPQLQPQPQLQHPYAPPTCDRPSPAHTDSLSPTSSRSTSPSRSRYQHSHIRLSIADLSQKLSAHTLNVKPKPRPHRPQPRHHASRTATPSPPCGATNDTFGEPDRSSRASSTETSCRRRQRQLHSRLQCDPQHLKALAELVEGMVKAGSQCFVYEAPGVVGKAGWEEEEDADDGEDDGTSTRTVRREQSVELVKGRTGVSKTGRGRRDGAGRGGAVVRRPER